MPGLQSNPHPPRVNSYRGRIEAPVRSTASQARTTHRGRLNPRAQHHRTAMAEREKARNGHRKAAQDTKNVPVV